MAKDGLSAVQASESFTVFLFAVWGWIAAEKACGDGLGHDSHFTAMLTALTPGLPAAPSFNDPVAASTVAQAVPSIKLR